MSYKTTQEGFWAGKFGEDYIQRNRGDAAIAQNLAFFSKALVRARRLSSCIEFGANIGLNLRALQLLYPNLEQTGIEINRQAAEQLATVIPRVLGDTWFERVGGVGIGRDLLHSRTTFWSGLWGGQKKIRVACLRLWIALRRCSAWGRR